jgi:hypothetical protein
VDPFEEKYGDRCALCDRRDVDDAWLWLDLRRLAPDVDCEFDERELSFCSQAHAAEYLAGRELTWEPHDHASHASGARLDGCFMVLGLAAIILSIVGVVALVRWIF